MAQVHPRPRHDTKIKVVVNGSLESYSRIVEVEAYAQTALYRPAPSAIPGTIEAEHFDQGGAGVAYHDTHRREYGQDYDQPPPHPLPAFRQPTDVDIYKAAGYSNNYLVLSHAGDWMTYTVDVEASASRARSARHLGGTGGAARHFPRRDGRRGRDRPIQIPDTN